MTNPTQPPNSVASVAKALAAAAAPDANGPGARAEGIAAILATPGYEPRDLAKLLPPDYWETIKALGKANIRGAPGMEAIKCAMRFIVINAARNAGHDETGKLYVAEITEHALLRAFCDLAKVGAQRDN